jgi:superfamily I DNA/RNA helicase
LDTLHAHVQAAGAGQQHGPWSSDAHPCDPFTPMSPACPPPCLFYHCVSSDRRLRQANGVDFDDIMGLSLAVLVRSPTALAELRARFRHVLVDEFQVGRSGWTVGSQ